jgi:hypothetical protein
MSSTGQESSGVYKMTPEQKANLKNFGKKNGLSEQKVQTQLNSKQPVVQQPVQQVQQVQQPVAQQPVQPVQQVQQPVAQQPVQQRLIQNPSQECETYFCYQDESAGNLEIDLITFREKGVETRYLSLLFSGLDVRQNPPVPQEAFLNIESREEFEKIKAFFAQLDWED